MDKKDGLIWGFTVIVFTALFVGVILYYTNQIDRLKAEATSLNPQLTDLRKPDLVTSLGVSEKLNTSNRAFNEDDPSTYNHLSISGTVTNNGSGAAYHAGLHVEARTTTGEVVINMTVPIAAGTYGLDNQFGASELSDLSRNGIGSVQTAIYHKGVAATWSVTPVCDP